MTQGALLRKKSLGSGSAKRMGKTCLSKLAYNIYCVTTRKEGGKRGAGLNSITFLFFSFFLLAVLGLRCCACAFSNCGEPGLLFVAVHGLLIVVASFVVEHRL